MIDIRGNVIAERFMIKAAAEKWRVVDTAHGDRTVFTSSFMSWCETCIERLTGRYDGMVAQWAKHYRVKV